MHMSDALISPSAGLGFCALSGGIMAYACSRTVKEADYGRKIPLMGAMGAFVFAAQMINFAIPGTGSSGHIGGGLLLAMLLGPHAAFVVIGAILVVQCLFFMDGGVLALGCNIFNLGFWPAFVGYPLFLMLAGKSPGRKRLLAATIAAVIVSLEAGALCVVFQTLLSGRTELPFAKFAPLMLAIHLPIAVGEGLVTAAVYDFARRALPVKPVHDCDGTPLRAALYKVITALSVAALIVAGVLSWFASTSPDGLEWAVGKVSGSEELGEKFQSGIKSALGALQSRTAFMPDYAAASGGAEASEPPGTASWPEVKAETSAAGLLGAAITALVLIGSALAAGKIAALFAGGGRK